VQAPPTRIPPRSARRSCQYDAGPYLEPTPLNSHFKGLLGPFHQPASSRVLHAKTVDMMRVNYIESCQYEAGSQAFNAVNMRRAGRYWKAVSMRLLTRKAVNIRRTDKYCHAAAAPPTRSLPRSAQKSFRYEAGPYLVTRPLSSELNGLLGPFHQPASSRVMHAKAVNTGVPRS